MKLKIRLLAISTLCLTSVAGATAAESAGDARLELQFRDAFAFYCRSGAVEEVGITGASATLVCDCLYDYARDRTSQSVKQTIVELPPGSAAMDFDLAYANATDMERSVVDSITSRYVHCVDTLGVRESTDDQP